MNYFPSYQSYRTAWTNAFLEDPPIPLNIDIELSSACNLSCPFCYISDPKYIKPQPRFMLPETLRLIIQQAKKLCVPAIKLNWIGEPTLHPLFNWSVEHVYSNDFFDIIINTNGNYRQSLNNHLMLTTKLIFSLDSLKLTTYNKMRINSNLKNVIDNIKYLIDKRHSNIWIRRVITNVNKHENFKQDCIKEFKSDYIHISEHNVFNRNSLFKTEFNRNQKIERQYCGYPSQRLVIGTNGDIFPCCLDAHRTMKLGNIYKHRLIDIWLGKNLKWIRDHLRRNKMPSKTCRNCESWMAYKHPNRNKIQDKDIKNEN